MITDDHVARLRRGRRAGAARRRPAGRLTCSQWQPELEYLRACPLGSVPPGPHPRARPAGYYPERPRNKQQYLRCRRCLHRCHVGDSIMMMAISVPAACQWCNKGICSSRCGLAAMQRGYRHRLHRRYSSCSSCLSLGRIIVSPSVPAATVAQTKNIQAVTLAGS